MLTFHPEVTVTPHLSTSLGVGLSNNTDFTSWLVGSEAYRQIGNVGDFLLVRHMEGREDSKS